MDFPSNWSDPNARRATIVLIAALAIIPYVPTFLYGFVLDDVSVIAGNSALHASNGWLAAFTSSFVPTVLYGEIGRYRPVSGSLFALLWQLGGGHPWIFHVAAVLANAAAALGVLALLRRALPAEWALAGAALFATAPVHVEAVANIVGFSEVLAAIGLLACALILLRASPTDESARTIGVPSALAGALCYLLALGSKESAAGAPAIALLLWWGWRAPDTGAPPRLGSLIRRGAPFWGAIGVALAVYVTARSEVVGAGTLGSAGTTEPWAVRVWATIATWPTVARLLTLPGTLHYHYRDLDATDPSITPHAVLGLALAAAAVGAAGWFWRRGDRRPITALTVLALAFLPASNLIIPIGQRLGERNLYGASIGGALLGGWIFAAAARFARPRVVAIVAAAVVAFGFARTLSGVQAWRSNPDLWAHGIEADSLDYRPQWSLGIWYLLQGDLVHGGPLVERAHELEPGETQLAADYAQVLQASGLMDSSLAVLRATQLVAPNSKFVRDVYLTTMIRAGHADVVISELRAAGTSDPLGGSRFRLLGQAFDARGTRDSAIVYFSMAIDSANDAYDLRLTEAVVLERSGRAEAGHRVRASMAEQHSPTALEASAIRARIHQELKER